MSPNKVHQRTFLDFRVPRLALAILVVVGGPLMAATNALAGDWIKTDCTSPEQSMCVASVEVKGSGAADSSYAVDPNLKAVAHPFPVWSGDGYVVHLIRPVNPYSGGVYGGVPQCQAPPNSLMFLDVVRGSEAYCRDLVAGTRPSGQVPSLEGKTVRVKVRMGSFVPRYSVVVGSGRGDLAEASVPNRTWSVDTATGQNVLTLVLKPEPTDGLLESGAWCSFASGCDSGPANWRGIVTYAFFGDFSKFTYPDAASGMTVFTNAFRYDSLQVDAVRRSLSVRIAGPHLRMDGTTNSAFVGLFIPAALANSPVGFGLPANDEALSDALRAYRDGARAQISAALTRDSGGTPTGVFAEAAGITFSAPTYEFRGPERVLAPPDPVAPPVAKPAAPAKPSAKTSVNKKKRIFSAVVTPEAGALYAIKASQNKASVAAPKKAKVKVGKCVPVSKTKKVNCSIKLAKGKWFVGISPAREGVLGPALVKLVKLK